MERKHTKLGNSYWDNTGYYQSIYDRLHDNLVPGQGEAETLHGELIRCIGRLYYDYCNNGNINVMSCETEMDYYTCHQCDGSGEEVYPAEFEDDEDEVEPCNDCGGSGEQEEEVDGDPIIVKHWQVMIDFLYENLEQNKVVADLESYLKNNYGYYEYDDKSMNIYDKVVDEVCYVCMTTENKKIKNVETFESFKRNVYKKL